MTNWHQRWLDRAKQLASWSKDPSTKVGCVLVRGGHAVAEGYNGFPHGIADTPDRLNDRTQKYPLTVHAEANAVAHAARFGHLTAGSTAFSTLFPCPPCAALLIQAGVVMVVTAKLPDPCRYCRDGLPRHASGAITLGEVPAAEQTAEWFHATKVRSSGGFPLDVWRACTRTDVTDRWASQHELSRQLFQEAGVPVMEL